MPEPCAVAAALGLPSVTAATRKAGYDATVWRAELAGGCTVALRLLRPDVTGECELAALRLAGRHTDLAPAVIATGTCEGRVAIAMTWCRGRPIGELLGSGGDPHRLGVAFGAALRDLHRPVEGQVLCHFDYQPFNVLATNDGVTGIVDWANARVDDPRRDLAWTTVVLHLAPVLGPDVADAVEEFTASWHLGYGGGVMTGLEPFLAEAARRQRADWERRPGASSAVLARVRAVDDLYAR